MKDYFKLKTFSALAICVPVLLLTSCDKNNANTTTTNGSATVLFSDSVKLPIACVNVDSVLINYDYAQDVNARLTKKMEDVRLSINQKTKKLEKDMKDFQMKVDNNSFLSQDRAQQEYNRIQKQQVDLEQSAQQMQNDWMMDQQKENMQISDSINLAIELLNADGKYEFVYSKNALLFSKPHYDITKEVSDLLNSRYKKASSNADKK